MKRRIYKKWLKNPMNRRLIWKFCNPFPEIPPVAIVKKHDPMFVFEQLSKHTDMLIQREMDRLCIPKELLLPINIGASGNTTASMIGYGVPVIEHPERVYILKPTDNEEPDKENKGVD